MTYEPFERAALVAIDRHVGARLAQLRKLRGVNQIDLGAYVGVSFQQIQKYERALNRVSASRLFAFATRLGVPVTALFEGLDPERLTRPRDAFDTPPDPAPDLATLDTLFASDMRALSVYARLTPSVRAALRTLILEMEGKGG